MHYSLLDHISILQEKLQQKKKKEKKLEDGMKALIKQEERLMLPLHARLSM